MPSSLHVSLPDEMRAYVDLRTGGQRAYATPSEYVRALIRSDMEREAERFYVFRELLKAREEIRRGETIAGEDVERQMEAYLNELEQVDR